MSAPRRGINAYWRFPFALHPLLGAKRKLFNSVAMSAFDPKGKSIGLGWANCSVPAAVRSAWARRIARAMHLSYVCYAASGFVSVRTLLMKSSVARLRERFFRVMIATFRRILGNSTGKILSVGFLRGSRTQ
jgi:hypothetical protein